MNEQKREVLNEILALITADLDLAMDAFEEGDMEQVRYNLEMAIYGLGSMDKQINFYK